MGSDRSSRLPEGHAELKAALRTAVASDRRMLNDVERLVRDYVRVLRAHGIRSERAVIEAKALVVEATGDPLSDPLSGLLASVVTWTLSEYDER